jgi:tetratricopeptide (TPR) repeat protein
MTRRAILQIGTEKTGTTTLQTFLARNRDLLAERGIRYPRFPGDVNQTGLAAYAMDDARDDPLRHPFGLHRPQAVPAFRARFEKRAAAELGQPETVIFCNEHCHSRLTTRDEVARLRDLLAPHFDRIDVSVYLRRQDQLALSLYSTRLKSGGTDTDILPRVTAASPLFNYDRALALWEEVFGRDRVRVRLFDRRELKDGDIVADFLAAWDLGRPGEYRRVGKMNEGIGAEAQAYLRQVNAHPDGLPGLPVSVMRGRLADQLARHFPGSGARPARSAAEAFYDLFRESNAAVCRRHFPDRDTLFDEDFSAYPDVADPLDADPVAVARVAARLHAVQTHEICRLECEIRIRDARLASERGEGEAALAAVRGAVALLPAYPEAQRALGEYLLRLDRPGEAAIAAMRATELRPDNGEYWHFLGIVERRNGNLAAAAAAQERALEIAPDHGPSTRELAAIRAATDAASRARA